MLAGDPSLRSGAALAGPSTCQVRSPRVRTSPYAGTRTGTSASAAHRSTAAAPDVGVPQPGDLDLADGPAVEHARQAVDVVGVEVGEHDDRHPTYPETLQAPVDQHGVRPRVDHDGPGSPRVEDQSVALPDVAGDHHPAVGRPARGRQRPHHHDHEQHAQAHRGAAAAEHGAEPGQAEPGTPR